MFINPRVNVVVVNRRDIPAEYDHDDKNEDDKTTVIASSDSEQELDMATFSAPTSRPKKSTKTSARRATPSEPTPEPMETSVDLAKHFPKLDDDDDDKPWQKTIQKEKYSSQVFIIDE